MRIDFRQTAAQRRIFIFWALFFLLLLVLTFILPFNGLYGQDSHEYYRFSQHLHDVVFAAVPIGDFFYPVFYPLLGALLGYFMPHLFAMQVISLLSLFLSAWCLYRILEREYKGLSHLKALYVSLFLLCSPFLMRYSFLVMSDMLALTLITAALFQIHRYYKQTSKMSVILFGLFAGLAVATRYVCVVVMLIPVVSLLFHSLILKKNIVNTLLLSGSLVLGFIPQLAVKGVFRGDIQKHPLWQEWSFGNMMMREFNIVEGHLQYTLPNILYPIYTWIHPGFFLLGLPLLLFIRKEDLKRPLNILLLSTFGMYAIFLAGVPFQNSRFLILGFPFVVLFFYPLYRRAHYMLLKYSSSLAVVLYAALFILQIGMSVRAIYPFWKMNKIERNISEDLKKRHTGKLYTFGIDVALRSYGASFPIINLRHDSIAGVASGDFVLFNQSKFEDQWDNKIVMQHWQELNDRFQLLEVRTYEQNWKLYELR